MNEAAVAAAELFASDSDVFHRYSGRSLTRNAGVLVGASSTQYYWSLSNPYINDFRKVTEQRENSNFNYEGYDDRTTLITLASVLYYMLPAKDSAPVPYGFTYVDTVNAKDSITEETLAALMNELQIEELTEDQIKVVEDTTKSDYKIYRNDYVLPLAYTYDSCISTDTWNALSAVEKQEALLSTAVIDDCGIASEQVDLNFTCKDIDYKLSCNGNSVSLQDNAFVVTSDNATVTLNFEGIPDSETYFSIKGLFYEGVPEYDLYFGGENVDPLNLYNDANYNRLNYSERESIRKNKLFWTAPTSINITLKSSTGVSKTVNYRTEYDSYYSDRHDFTVNLDYSEDAAASITITFSKAGIYTFDSINITCQPMYHYVDQVNALKENTLENVEINTNTVTGTISLQSPKLLCLAIPYSDGWSAYVDGRETELYRANIMYMALALDSGEHTVELVYKTPLLKVNGR